MSHEGPDLNAAEAEDSEQQAEVGLDLDNKSLEELAEMKKEIGDSFVPGMDEKEAQQWSDALAEIEAQEARLRQNSSHETPVAAVIPDELIKIDLNGKSLNELKDIYAKASDYDKQDLAPEDRQDLDQLFDDLDSAIGKAEQTEVPAEESPEEKPKQRAKKSHKPSRDEQAAADVRSELSKSLEDLTPEEQASHKEWLKTQLASKRMAEKFPELEREVADHLRQIEEPSRVEPEQVEKDTPEAETSNSPEDKEDLEIPPPHFIDTVADILVEDEKEPGMLDRVKEFIAKDWEKTKKTYVMGVPVPDLILGTGTGAGASYLLRRSIKTAFGAAGVGAIAGAGAALSKKYGMAYLKERQYQKAEGQVNEEPGKMLEMVRKGKLDATDALKLIAERKAKVNEKTTNAEINELLTIEDMLIEKVGSFDKLKGSAKLEEYVSLVTSVPIAYGEHGVHIDAKKILDESSLLDTRKIEIAEATGRKATGVVRAVLAGAIGGVIGAEVFQGVRFAIDHFGHHGEAAASHAMKAAATVGAVKSAPAPDLSNLDLEHLRATGIQVTPPHTIAENPLADLKVHAAPLPDSPGAGHPASFETSHAAGNTNEEALKVKGTVWSTVKNFFKSKGINATNDEINTATRFLAHENHIGIAADHPMSGSYDVLDTKIADGTALHGVERLADIHHLPHIAAEHGIPDLPKMPDIYIEPMHSPYDVAHSLGFEPTDYNPMDASHHTVGEAVNWIGNASESGGKVEGALRLAGMQPSAEEMHMTIDEFLKHRFIPSAAEANARTVHTIAELIGKTNKILGIGEHHVHAAAQAAHEAVQHAPADMPHLEGGDIESSLSDHGDNLPTNLEGFYEEGRLTPGFGPDAVGVWNMTPVHKSIGEASLLEFVLSGLGAGVAGAAVIGLGANELHKRTKAKQARSTEEAESPVADSTEAVSEGTNDQPEAIEAEESKVESKPEMHNFRFGELELLIKEKLGDKARIERIEFTPTPKGVRLTGELNAGLTGGRIKLNGQLENKGDTISITGLTIEARSYVKSMIEGAVNDLVPAIKKHFEQLYKKPVSKIEVTSTGLVVTTE